MQELNNGEQFKIGYKYTEKRKPVTALRSGLWRIQRKEVRGLHPPSPIYNYEYWGSPLKIQIHCGTPLENEI